MIIENDPESDESDGDGIRTGDGELPSLQKTKRLYTASKEAGGSGSETRVNNCS